MSVIAPCITVENEDAFKAAVERLKPFAERVHIDISDGEFAPVFLYGDKGAVWPEEWKVDIHAMVARPSEYVHNLIAKKPNMIIFHAEVNEDLIPILKLVRQQGIKVGVALMRPTVPTELRPIIEAVDHVMIFSGDLGKHGGTASLMQLEKVRLIKAIRSDVEIGWDGGISSKNAFTLSQSGVEVLNVGGAIANSPDPAAAYQQLVAEIHKHGVI